MYEQLVSFEYGSKYELNLIATIPESLMALILAVNFTDTISAEMQQLA